MNEARRRFEELTSCNKDIDGLQLELVDAQNAIRSIKRRFAERGFACEGVDQALGLLDDLAEEVAKKTYG